MKQVALKTQADRAAFSRSVIALYKHLLQVHRPDGTKKFKGRSDNDVMRVAAGLVAIHRLLEAKLNEMGFVEEVTSGGLRDGFNILQYLVSGKRHPVAEHVAGLRNRRPQRQEATLLDQEGRSMLVGAMLAYSRASGKDEAKSIRAIITAVAELGVDVAVPVGLRQ